MNNNKKIGLVVILVIIAGAIWYLEAIQAHPGGNSVATPISIDSQSQNESSTPIANTSTTQTIKGSTASVSPALKAIASADQKAGYKPAIEIARPTGFINAAPGFTLSSLIGKKVILLDFWTYSCINCIRTLPYLTSWYTKYHDAGLEIVGIHTPEFDFEKNIANVQTAVRQEGIKYPVILDSNHATWDAYSNLYWPHEYLIDISGYIVHDHIGEGSYDETEAEIQKLLAQRNTALGSGGSVDTSMVDIKPANLTDIYSPETYFGADRNSSLANGRFFVNGVQDLIAPGSTQINRLYLTGKWNFNDQYATNLESGARIIYRYNAGKVYFVGSASTPVTVEVLQDGKPVSGDAGSDVHNGKVMISGSRLYNLINNADGGGEHVLELIIDSPGLQAFTFTFG